VKSHPDRCAATLATVPVARARQGAGPFAPPGAGARDCRIDLKLLRWRALEAGERSDAARARLAGFDATAHPDLWAGTVQDGVARGFAVALEEAIDLAGPGTAPPAPPVDPTRVQVFEGRELLRKKDLLVAGAGARIRFTRQQGVLFVDRRADVASPDCLRFESRADHGTLDAFAADERERPRLFSARFLRPVRYTTGAGHGELVLAGRLGRTAAGIPCRITFTARADQPLLQLRVAIENRHVDHRLRLRLLGVPAALVRHDCTDVREIVQCDGRPFVAFTLVRACGRLLVDGVAVDQPGAQCLGPIEHTFHLGC
jgi:hypothetical protein